jgi:folate-binding protein YgfZ
MVFFTRLPHRQWISLAGADRRSFLQGLISNDIQKVSSQEAIYTLLLTPQGKFLFDLLIAETAETLWIQCERVDELLKKFSLYKLRSQITLEKQDTHSTVILWGENLFERIKQPHHPGTIFSFEGTLAIMDPRLPAMGITLCGKPNQLTTIEHYPGLIEAPLAEWDYHRLSLGIPDGTRDMIIDKSIPLECGMDALHAIDWNKGCYMGQELTARTHYRGLVRKRLLPVTIIGETPAFGTAIHQDGVLVGDMRSSSRDRGLAFLRLDALSKKEPLTCGTAHLNAFVLPWMSLAIKKETSPS